MAQGPIRPKKDADGVFVGYAPMKPVDRRFLLGLTAAGLAVSAGAGWLIGKNQAPAGRGDWDMGTPVTLTGELVREPYAHIRHLSASGDVRTVYLACETKCGGREILERLGVSGGYAEVTGTLIKRGRHEMLAVKDDDSWIRPADRAERARPPQIEDLGETELTGMIVDTKCWFGAMRPNEGVVHKACAMLCIANGLPPYFAVRDGRGNEQGLLIVGPQRERIIQEILPDVADPVRAAGRLVRIDDIIEFRMRPETLQRL